MLERCSNSVLLRPFLACDSASACDLHRICTVSRIFVQKRHNTSKSCKPRADRNERRGRGGCEGGKLSSKRNPRPRDRPATRHCEAQHEADANRQPNCGAGIQRNRLTRRPKGIPNALIRPSPTQRCVEPVRRPVEHCPILLNSSLLALGQACEVRAAAQPPDMGIVGRNALLFIITGRVMNRRPCSWNSSE